MSATISIVNYDMGNIYSIVNAVRNRGFEAKLVETPSEIAASDLLILPGVGAYRDAMAKLRGHGLDVALHEYARSGRALLGICLGMQLLFESSEENGGVEGLGILAGSVHRFPPTANYRIPQIQWNRVNPGERTKMLKNIAADERFYFLHSYFVVPKQPTAVISTTTYCGISYCSAIEVSNVWAAQFHPEKSGSAGLKMLSNFLNGGE